MKYLKPLLIGLVLGAMVGHYIMFIKKTNEHHSYFVSQQKQLNVHWNTIGDLFKMDFVLGTEHNLLVEDHNKLEDRVIALEKKLNKVK